MVCEIQTYQISHHNEEHANSHVLFLAGYVSIRYHKAGSLFIQALTEIFSKYAGEYHIHEMFKMVRRSIDVQNTLMRFKILLSCI